MEYTKIDDNTITTSEVVVSTISKDDIIRDINDYSEKVIRLNAEICRLQDLLKRFE